LAWACVFCYICLKKVIDFIIFDQLKEPAAGGIFISLRNVFSSNLAKISPPPRRENTGYAPD